MNEKSITSDLDRIPNLPLSDQASSSGEEEILGGLVGGVNLLVYIGFRRFGIVHHVPDMFYVATVFFHFFGVPLIPLRSFIFFVGPTESGKEEAFRQRLSLKSVVLAWVRALLILIAIVSLMATIGALLMGIRDVASLNFLVTSLPTVVVSLFGIRMTRLFMKASPAKAAELATRIGFNSNIASEIGIRVEYGVSFDERSEASTINCPNCGRELASTTLVCPRCETRLNGP